MQLSEAQYLVGVPNDGVWGPITAKAIVNAMKEKAKRLQLFNLQMSEHFTLAELCKSDSQMRDWTDRNLPNSSQLLNLVKLCQYILEPVRAKFGPVRVTSGFRIWTATSQHGKGEAADFEVTGVDNLVVCKWIKDNLPFDQIIREGYGSGGLNAGWIHCSYRHSGGRRSILRTATGRAPYLRGLGT